ncbi:type II secretion system protein [Halopseudomonas pelagia]|uniref:General secretion pathway protein GspG n=1 Tax=Halopseudomonas pelagia TaxID=553151 RepID=A0AA91Z541_9GAMM|nr:type II secretion system protein [Halopseudomonas pelagia]PCC98523.1 general secretion pathway protein GspG [Halopseudomonas pelagia]QFY57455.1 type II secretion system protein [Halopseudomonas pelagia]
MNTAARRSGFTLIELVISMAILALLASMALPLTETLVRRSKEQELKTSLYQIRDAIDRYKMLADAGFLENSAGTSGYPPSLELLVDGVRDLRSIKGEKVYFLRRIPRDPFADAKIPAVDTWGKRSYASSAEDPREGEDVFDVYSLMRGDGLNGIAYRDW